MRERLIEKLGNEIGSEIDAESIRDVRPDDRGMRDESWYVFRTVDGRWHTYSDHADQIETHPTEADAEAYWAEAGLADEETP